MGFHAKVDAMSDEEVESALGASFRESAKELGVTPKELLKMIVPDTAKDMPKLTEEEIEYGKKVAERLNKK